MKTCKRVLFLTLVGVPLLGLALSLVSAVLPQVATSWQGLMLNQQHGPPAYIKDVVALKEGDGITVYITLADAQGRLTRAEGFLSIEIREGTDGTVAWMQRRYVTPEDFEVATVGLGTFARTTLLYNFGRIAASTLGLRPRGQRLTVAVSFFKDGQHLAGEQSVWL